MTRAASKRQPFRVAALVAVLFLTTSAARAPACDELDALWGGELSDGGLSAGGLAGGSSAMSSSSSSSSSAPASTCEEICGTANPCTIDSAILVAPDAVLDCSGRDLTLTPSGALHVDDGFMTLLARNVTVNATAASSGNFRAHEVTAGTAVGVTLELTGTLALYGAIRGNNPSGGGTIDIDVDGDLNVFESQADGIEANGTANGAPGGEITLNADGHITLADPIQADSAGTGTAAGGSIDVTAGGNLTLAQDGELRVRSRQDEAGTIRLVARGILAGAAGNISVGTPLNAEGRGDSGTGGLIELAAAGSLITTGALSARGGVGAGGGFSAGGSVSLEAGCGGLQINNTVNVSGGELGTGLDGGAIVAESGGALTVASGVSLITEARAHGGDGGSVDLRAQGVLTLQNGVTIDTTGDTASGAKGSGGAVHLSGCEVKLNPGAVIDAGGFTAGSILLNAAKLPPASGGQPLWVSAAASLKATGTTGGTNGRIELAPFQLKRGQCSQAPTLTCFLAADCAAQGCQNSDCLYANPDTEGVQTQFTVTPSRLTARHLAGCSGQCP